VLLQRCDDEPRNLQAQVDLQAKTTAPPSATRRSAPLGASGQPGFDRKRLVSVDECGSNIGLAPLHARAPNGERARGKNTRRFWRAWGPRGWGNACRLEGGATRAVFEFYVERGPAPLIVAVETRTPTCSSK
jgi:hypothetical protein